MNAPADHPHPPNPKNDEALLVTQQGLRGSKSFGDGLRANRTTAEDAISTLRARFDGREPWPSPEEARKDWLRQIGPLAAAQRQPTPNPRPAPPLAADVRIAAALERIAAALEALRPEGRCP